MKRDPSGRTRASLASENQARQGRREPSYLERTRATEDAAWRWFAAARAHRVRPVGSRQQARDRLVPRDAARDLLAGASPSLRLVDVTAQPRARRCERGRAWLAHQPGTAIGDNLEGAAGIRCRDDGLLREERLVRDHSEVLVDRRVVDGEAARIEIRELLLVHAAGEARAAVEPAPL